jgi:hypothetical protein
MTRGYYEHTPSGKLRPALAGVAKTRSLSLVTNEDLGSGVAWADPSLDITPLVVAALAP